MKRGQCVGLASVLCLVLLAATPAWGLVVPATTPADFTGLWTGTADWTFSKSPTYGHGLSSLELISTDTMLTAGHVQPQVGEAFRVGPDGSRTIVSVTYSPTADICLVKLDLPVVMSPHASLFNGVIPVNAPAIMIGCGYSGTLYDDYYSPSSSTTVKKRWGTNSVDSANSVVTLGYHAGDTEFESGVAGGDSGGGTYIKVGDTWKLMGVITNLYNDNQGRTAGAIAQSVPYNYQWIVTNTTLPGDANFDEKVTFSDYLTLEQNFGKSVGMDFGTGDFNFDGKVSFADYLLLEQNFGKTFTAVPEPCTIGLLLVGGLATLRKRSR